MGKCRMFIYSAVCVATVLLCSALPAQTVIYGGSSLGSTKIFGDPTVTTIINAATTFTRIYVVFPPATWDQQQ
jgi:hypothetical protein